MKDLNEFAQKLIEEGFRVFMRPGIDTHLFASIDGTIGYVQESIGVGYRYSTVHKPNACTGTGFQFADGPLNAETMRRCCRCIVPEGFSMMYAGSVKKWKLEDWIKDNPALREVTKMEKAQ